jgi:alpha,alpha-trehalase
MSEGPNPEARVDPERFDAAIFDLDGVVTDTRSAHEAAWKRLFDAYREEREARGESAYEAFTTQDYLELVDGKPRLDGLRDFLASRGVDLPEGSPDDPPEAETIHGLGTRKNAYYREWLASHGADAYEDALALIRGLRAQGLRTAVISASRNCKAVLESAGAEKLFDARVDGETMAELGLPGKPDPAIFLKAAERVDADPARAVVVEDALAGVEAGAAGGFGLVVGVDRSSGGDQGEALRARGAHAAVTDLRSLLEAPGAPPFPLSAAPSAWSREAEILERLSGGRTAIFLDYDGTLTPIVRDFRKATLSAEMREALRALSADCCTAVISGRDLEDVRRLVGIESVYYAGSHGFDMAGPGGWRREAESAQEFLPDLDAAESRLDAAIGRIAGAEVERKRFSIAVHYRQAAETAEPEVERAVDAALEGSDRLRKSRGRKVFEIQPAIDWHKGKAVMTVLAQLGLDAPDAVPLYIGDDVTDENAFRELERDGRGFGIVVRGADERETWARYALGSPEEVQRFLGRLAEAMRGGTA